jgi:hypothetical protein
MGDGGDCGGRRLGRGAEGEGGAFGRALGGAESVRSSRSAAVRASASPLRAAIRYHL